MANYKYSMDLKKIRRSYRHKYVILCKTGASGQPNTYERYKIADVINQPGEKNLVFMLKDDNVFRKMVFGREIIKTGKGDLKMGNEIYKCRIVNARNFPIADSSYFNMD